MTNKQTARADSAIAYHQLAQGCPERSPLECVADLLADLRHWCQARGVSYTQAAQLADDHYLRDAEIPQRLLRDLGCG